MPYTNPMKLSIILPCYNEAKNIPLILDSFSGLIENRNMDVILVNNGSTDDSASVLEKYLPQYPFAKTVLVPVNKGYGFGILEGLKASTGDFLGWTHADLQTDPKDIIQAYDLLEKENWSTKIFVKGDRINRPLSDQAFTIGMGIFNSILFCMPLSEINAQPNIFPRHFFEKWENPPIDYAIDLYAHLMSKKHELTIKRISVYFPNRQFGISSWNDGFKGKWNYIKRILKASFRLKKDLR